MSDGDTDKKRKRSENSIVSDIDTPNPTKEKKKHKKKENRKSVEKIKETVEGAETSMEGIQEELRSIKDILSNVLRRDDPHLEHLIKTTFNSMKDFLASVSHRLDVLENKLFEKETKNGTLKQTVKDLEKKILEKEDENTKLQREIEKVEVKAQERLNDIEQYSRRNSVRIDGVKAAEGVESFETTAAKAVEVINNHLKEVKIKVADIDIAHRIGKPKDGKQQIIVKFVSRSHAINILKNKKMLKGTGVFINEDLTRTNQLALACVKKKLPDEIESAWTRDGRVRYKNKMGNIHTLQYKDYQSWFDLPWPESPKRY